jgi:hypothetical protein
VQKQIYAASRNSVLFTPSFSRRASDALAGANEYKRKPRLFGKFFAACRAAANLRTLFIKLEFIFGK